jgi:hypothetical protein
VDAGERDAGFVGEALAMEEAAIGFLAGGVAAS